MKKSVLALSLAVSLVAGASEVDGGKGLARAKQMGAHLVSGNYPGVVEMTHPEIVAVLGGKERVAGELAAGFEEVGLTFHRIEFGQPEQLRRYGDIDVGVFPYAVYGDLQGAEFNAQSLYVGMTHDGEWVFVECEVGQAGALEELVPGYDGQLDLSAC